jgi:hypothetical protein
VSGILLFCTNAGQSNLERFRDRLRNGHVLTLTTRPWVGNVTGFDKSARKGDIFSRDTFTYGPEREVYFCPGGTTLTRTGTRNDGPTMLSVRASMTARAAHPKLAEPEGATLDPRGHS